jgi:DNA-binding SARP family transcriptional activator/class 3 adenylate cyclase/tetratricopeptide (TPR) repeat protein
MSSWWLCSVVECCHLRARLCSGTAEPLNDRCSQAAGDGLRVGPWTATLTAVIEFALLGPLEVRRDGQALRLGGFKQRLLLGVLLVEANRAVSAVRLIDLLWGTDPPETAANILQQYISQLRRLLDTQGGGQMLVSQAPGYRLQVDPEQVDAARFERLATAARQAGTAGDDDDALQRYADAEALWRGTLLADLGDEPVVVRERSRMEELRLGASEDAFEIELRRGSHADVVAAIEAAAVEHPLRERLQGLLMRALYGSGRQAEALAVYRETKRLLSDELGIDPGPELQKLELSVLRHDPLIAAPTPEVRAPVRAVLDRSPHPAIPMDSCSSCGTETEPGVRFCPECASSNTVTVPAPREERKVVTVLFADLVGFTSRSEQLDPEDVRAFQSPYYARLRIELERFGGTVEKFIGDAVMALFGAPVAHEDDSERAVRAALAIRDWVLEQEAGLQLRIAVNTGEVLVTLGAQPNQGEGMASGDVVNTTARLQAAAPVNGILVGETTYRATSQVITYRPADPVAAKGKPNPVPAWEALEARSRFGVDLGRASRMPLVGRIHELGVLTDALARVRRDRSPQLVTIVGVPGIGKSRLVAELFRVVADDPSELIYWRQGRSLPYGDGVTFWALGEMVKAQAGILETDSPEQAEQKLHASVAELITQVADAQWIEGHLRPLAGLGSDTSVGSSDGRDEAFTAWRRYFEGLAEKGPLTLVFEDLHWADDNLLDFIEHLVDWASGVPMLVVCTARPELFERRSGWAGGKRNAIALSLSPLSDGETAQLISNLSERPVMAAETQQMLLTRAGGNPLYAEQYVRMLAERGDAEQMPLPETVQGIIAARLDALPAEEKSLLQTAAVIGKVFWLGAVAQSGGLSRRAAEVRLHALERKDFVQRARRSSVADEAEYAFLHVLVRDVAYGQIPRVRRAEQHRLAAEWIGSLGRTEDHAEMLAHHYLSALELWRAASQAVDPAFAKRALGSLSEAGDRASSLNAYASAAGFYQSALELAPEGSLKRAQLLFQLGRTRYIAGDREPELLAEACDQLRACGAPETAAEAESVLTDLHWDRGDGDRALEHLGRARALVEGREPSRAVAHVLSSVSGKLSWAGENEEAIRVGREALVMAEQFGLGDVRSTALTYIGFSRIRSGDLQGFEDLEQSLAIALEANTPAEISRTKGNLAAAWAERGQLARASTLVAGAEATASRFGLMSTAQFYRGERVLYQYWVGEWDDALAATNEFLAEVEAGSPHYQAPSCYSTRAQIRFGRDDSHGALADAERALDLARLAADPQNLYPTLAVCAHLFRESGSLNRAARLADEFLSFLRAARGSGAAETLHMLAWTLSALGRGQQLIEALPGEDVPWVHAASAFASGDLRQAADICGDMGTLPEEARDRLWLAQALIAENRRSEADIELRRALAFYRSVGATRYIRIGESLLAASA